MSPFCELISFLVKVVVKVLGIYIKTKFIAFGTLSNHVYDYFTPYYGLSQTRNSAVETVSYNAEET